MRNPDRANRIGRLRPGVLVQDTLIQQTINFIWEALAPWRDDPSRSTKTAEEELNADLHNFLQARANQVFPMVFFQSEQRQTGRRRVDISAKPTQTTSIQSKTYTIYDPFLLIEGKRLPAPSNSREREYVTGGQAASGGIQRFKMGLHGKSHSRAVIVGYIQNGNAYEWFTRIAAWLEDLAESDPEVWQGPETLQEFSEDSASKIAKSKSLHRRTQECGTQCIELSHLWVSMDQNQDRQ